MFRRQQFANKKLLTKTPTWCSVAVSSLTALPLACPPLYCVQTTMGPRRAAVTPCPGVSTAPLSLHPHSLAQNRAGTQETDSRLSPAVCLVSYLPPLHTHVDDKADRAAPDQRLPGAGGQHHSPLRGWAASVCLVVWLEQRTLLSRVQRHHHQLAVVCVRVTAFSTDGFVGFFNILTGRGDSTHENVAHHRQRHHRVPLTPL